MIKYMISAFLVGCVMSSPTAYAIEKNITWHLPFKASGGGFRLVDTMVKGLSERGWTIDLKAVGNCAVVKYEVESAKTPFVSTWENIYSARESDKCFISVPNEKEFVNIPAYSPYYLCVNKDSDISANDILSGKKAYTFSVFNFFSEQIVDELKKRINKEYKAVIYSSPRTALASGEVDVYIGTQGPAMMKDGQAKCYFNSGTTITNETIPLREANKNLEINKQSVYFTMAQNLSPEQMTELRSDIKHVMSNYEPWLQLAKLYEISHFNSEKEAIKFIQNTLK